MNLPSATANAQERYTHHVFVHPSSLHKLATATLSRNASNRRPGPELDALDGATTQLFTVIAI